MSPDFDAIQRDIEAGVPLKKILREQSMVLKEVGPDGKSVVVQRMGVDMEFLEGMKRRLVEKREDGEAQQPTEAP